MVDAISKLIYDNILPYNFILFLIRRFIRITIIFS